MFWRKKTYRADASSVMATMSEQEKIETRCMVVLVQALREPVHVMTVTQESATRHADFFARVGEGLGVAVAQLPVAGSDTAISVAYRTNLVVGPISAFIENFDRGLHREGGVALVEGEPPEAARLMLFGYRSVSLS
jgi:hypothetical protein